MRETKSELLQAKKDEVHEELICSPQQFIKERDFMLNKMSNLTEHESFA